MYLLICSFFCSFIHFSILFLGGIHDAVGRYTNLFATDSLIISLLHRHCHQTSMVLSNTLRGHTGYPAGTYADALAHESSQPGISFTVWHLWKWRGHFYNTWTTIRPVGSSPLISTSIDLQPQSTLEWRHNERHWWSSSSLSLPSSSFSTTLAPTFTRPSACLVDARLEFHQQCVSHISLDARAEFGSHQQCTLWQNETPIRLFCSSIGRQFR